MQQDESGIVMLGLREVALYREVVLTECAPAHPTQQAKTAAVARNASTGYGPDT